jgi:hypothetical protein
MHQVS